MKVKVLDRAETGHTIIPELEGAQIVEQDGLRILSRVPMSVGGLKGEHYTMLFAKGAVVDLPDRLAKRLVKIGVAAE